MRVHFIGCNGVSMRRLMELTRRMGHEVTGSDAALAGHRAENVAGADLAVYTAAIGADNVELAAAKNAGIPTVERAEYLAATAECYARVIAIAGTHGKTTTTAMTASVLAPLLPTVHVGGELVSPPAKEQSRYFVTEACEYRRGMLYLRPDVGVILGAELDHTDCYRSADEVREAFSRFAARCRLTLYNGDDVGLAAAIGRKNAITFGLGAHNDFRARNVALDEWGRPSFDLSIKGLPMGRLRVPSFGEHQVCNALAAAAVGLTEGLGFSEVRNGLAAFGGVKRRMEFLGRVNGARIYTDYAHHPTEIRALVRAARHGCKRLIIAFEPHTFSRTRDLMDEFETCFAGADVAAVLPVYGSRESGGKAESEAVGKTLCARAAKHGDARFFPSYSALGEWLGGELRPGDRAVFTGAGTIDRAGRTFVSSSLEKSE